MSDKLILEFYDSEDPEIPVACVLALNGGDNPSSAATTVSDFFECVSALAQPRFDDAGLLAARFIVWQSMRNVDVGSLEFCNVGLLPFHDKNLYQTIRIYAMRPKPYIHCVRDEWTTHKELREAAIILRQESVDACDPVHFQGSK